MAVDPCSIMAKRLTARLSALKVEGEVIEKQPKQDSIGSTGRNTLILMFKDRTIEKTVDEEEFERTRIGDAIQFNPPVPERDPCAIYFVCCLIVCLVAALSIIWAISCSFSGRTALLLAVVSAGGLSLIAWATICSRIQNKFLQDLKGAVRFYEE